MVPLAAVARALGPLVDEVVFIGGAIAPLLQSEPPFPRVRPTLDVDGVITTRSYSDLNRIQEQLRARGFQPDISGRHTGRWIGPDGTPFDLVGAGEHFGGTGNPWDAAVIADSVAVELEPGLQIRHASAPGFLALKWAAFRDRGQDDPLNSQDLEDLLALVASRPRIAEEVARSPAPSRTFVVEWVQRFLAFDYRDDLLAAHLNNATDVASVMKTVLKRLNAIALAAG